MITAIDYCFQNSGRKDLAHCFGNGSLISGRRDSDQSHEREMQVVATRAANYDFCAGL